MKLTHFCYKCNQEQELILVSDVQADLTNGYDVYYQVNLELRCKVCNNEWRYTCDRHYVSISDFTF